ncbi:BEM_HP_G0175660.mRNA.1.CDS.1 [Saccharomyces cerevisiae]|nr:BEM_HP_G0172800.mRNA.1.CDS.1 [Saccharomyces cerevisiae]CAI4993348.1 BEM_HP_G0175660.mRNA.1.CDS.1 [Saccharomyces cerevisiae]CAI6858244.1 BEM_HP_G0172800.mRNA.1.CDS.1 [Saccharomyces cerevisiae]CAI6872451.1 BEM_HP_G0175660.mRNA.1.CDS.1 [Saccharomyces cerevisiae]
MAKGAVTKLKFNSPIISTSDQLISTNELLDRLKALHEELASLDQDNTDLTGLDKYRDALVSRKLLKHKDVGIRAFTACCLSDILRLYAPDAPYTDAQLTDIFKLVLSQFEQLGDQENGYHIQQTYLITKLLEYRSIVLLADLPSSNNLLIELFHIFYDPNKSFPARLFNVIGGILGEVISEFDSVPLEVLRLIFNKFLTYNPNEIPEGLNVTSDCGYEVSLILCDTYSNRMSRHLTKYYSEIIHEATNDDNNSRLLTVVVKLHKLVLRLWETVPELINAVIGFIYHELSSENELFRKEATKLIGQILTSYSDLNFVSTHSDTFKAWISKIADISPDVRVEWTESIPQIIATREDIFKELNQALAKTFIDSDPRVRRTSVMIFNKVPVTEIWKNITNKAIYTSLLHLAREKHKEVRELCINTMAKFYSNSLNEIERTYQNKEIWEIIDTIPSTLYNLYYINDLNINEQVDSVIFEYLLPFEPDNDKRVHRLLTVLSHFDKKAFTSFFAFNARQIKISFAISKYIDFSKFLNNQESMSSSQGPIVMNKYNQTLQWLASGLSDSTKAIDALETIKQFNDERIFYLLNACVTNDIPFLTFKNCYNELVSKLQTPGLFKKYNISTGASIMPRDIAKVIQILLFRASPIIYNVSNISVLLNLSNNSDAKQLDLKRRILDDISKVNPTLFKDQIRTLKTIIKDLDDPDAEKNDNLSLEEALKTLYKASKTLKDQVDFDDTFFFTKLYDFAVESKPEITKYATKLIALSPKAEETLKKIKIRILPLDLQKDKYFTSHIIVLMEIFKKFPHVLNDDSTDIISYLIKEVLLSNQVVGDSKKEIDWIEDSLLNDTKYSAIGNKVFTLKLFTNKLRSIAPDVPRDELAESFTEKTMKLFFYLIASGGELISEFNKEFYPTPSNYQTKLRCVAGIQVLKLARISNLNNFIKPSDIIKLINLVEDESLPVRKTFLEQLKDYVANELISIKFLPLVFFTAYEPDIELKTTTKIWINFTFGLKSFKKGTIFERALPRLIHAIAHHPDIVEGLDSEGDAYLNALTTAIDYLLFYFDSIAAQENFSLLYYLSERVKNYQDKLVEDEIDEEEGPQKEEAPKKHRPYGQKMYIIGELSQMILLNLKEKKNWQHSAYPGKLNLPSDLFKPFATVQEAQLSFKTYIPESLTEKIQNNIKAKIGRILHTSQTQRQRLQKRLLAHENNESQKKKKKVHHARSQPDDEEGDGDRESDSDDDSYSPSNKNETKKGHENIVMKKLRVRKEVDYKDDEDDDIEMT